MYYLKFFETLAKRPAYWLFYIFGGLLLLAIALYFQHALDEQPCVVCIQMRLWISLLVIVASLGLLLNKFGSARLLINLSVIAIAIGMIERSYLLLGTERGFIFADCGFNLGLPAWFAIDDWLPWLYRIETSCGYTPELAFGITMAEALMVLSVLLFVLSAAVLFMDMFARTKHTM